MLALISINLGLINLLPIPMLDGGHLLVFAIEGVRRKPLSPKARERVQHVGLALILGLITILASRNDVMRYLLAMIVLGIDTATRCRERRDRRRRSRARARPRSDAPARGAGSARADRRACAPARPSAPRDLDAVAIGAGPGSFTGLRIGMATAKGIAFAAECPLWAVSSLAALAHAAGRDPDAIVVAVLDARRGEVYAGAYRATAIARSRSATSA